MLLLPLDVRVDLDDLLRGRILIAPHAQIADAAEAVGRRMGLALMFGQRQQRGIPRQRAHARRLGNRQSGVVADVRSGNPLGLVFVKERRPHAREIDLRGCRTAEDRQHQQHQAGDSDAMQRSTSVSPSSRSRPGHRAVVVGASATRRIDSDLLYVVLHADGAHFEPSASFLKCELVTNSCCRNFGSFTAVVTKNHSSPLVERNRS